MPRSCAELAGPEAVGFARTACFAALSTGSYALAVAYGLPGHVSMLVCGGATMAGVAGMAAVGEETYTTVVRRDYLTQQPDAPKSGDVCLWCLGPALVATGVQMFQYRERIRVLGPALLGTCAFVSLVNILGTAAIAPMLGISPEATLAATVRCVTVPMAVPTHARLCEEAGSAENVAFVALCAGVTGFLGFGFSRQLLSSTICGGLPLADAFSRGLATGAAAHVLGTASLAVLEPEAFAWGMLGMAASGVFSSAWICSCAPVRELAISLAHRRSPE